MAGWHVQVLHDKLAILVLQEHHRQTGVAILLLGDNVKVGDKVFGKAAGFSTKGALAEYALMDKDRVAVMLECWSFEEASCVSISFDTALAGVRKAQVKAGQNVLVYGASGGVGNYVMQILLAKGAKVTAVCSTRNVAYAKKLGCQQVIDYKTEDFTQLSQRFDVILGINGCQPMAVYQKLLRPDGIFVGVGNSKQASIALVKRIFSKQFTAVAGAFKSADGYLDYAKSLAERGQLTPLIDKVYSVCQVQGCGSLSCKMSRQGQGGYQSGFLKRHLPLIFW